ncbi:RluA family pseudouridine synthase [Heyndrickxia ginsengihumi]|uniref:RluA family pseudouridine synthase n=1 Tax=Heyndrickxia ginsengihumi TaxID=363870 RepID=UPI000471AB86|nr:RluA family pseudouridine synthase [Heyndrickxia ginsengihumi]
MKQFSLKWIIQPEDHHKEIKQYLKEHHISKRALTDIKFNGGKILVNRCEQNVRYRLQKQDVLEIIFPQEQPSESLLAEDISLEIIYEDESMIVINKPPYMSTIPSREHPRSSLANALMGYYQRHSIKAAIHIVTRLDRNTSGLVLVAKNRFVHHLFSQMQQKRDIHSTYEALAEGQFTEENGIIEAPIGRKETSIIEREVRSDGQYARTHFEVIQQYPNVAHLKLWLDTGRTHQIRVHMAYLGHPLVGDELYGGSIELYPHQALHCSQLTFVHPIENKPLTFHTKAPFLDKIMQMF